MQTHWVTTWFYEESAHEGGRYAQVRGDSSTEEFRDIYRRCIALFFATSSRVNPDARLRLFVNREWRRDASRTADEVFQLMCKLGVEIVIRDYTFSPPATWPKEWRNQFFVLDVLDALTRMIDPDDLILVLDSDIVWSGSPATHELWETIAARGAATYDVGYPEDYRVNGMTRRELTDVASSLGIHGTPLVTYSGGEFVGVRGDVCRALARDGAELWQAILSRHEAGAALRMEEAHLLSLLYTAHGIPSGAANPFIKRLWTQPFRFRNTVPEDVRLPLWHVPAEKRYGLARLYRKLQEDDLPSPNKMATALGIPKNSPRKVVLDFITALEGRARRSGQRM